MVACDARPTTTGATSPVPELSGRGSDFIVDLNNAGSDAGEQ